LALASILEMRHEHTTTPLDIIMQVRFLEEGERLVARPQGRMEAADGTDFAAAVEQRLQPKTRSVTIDLHDLQIVDFGGIRAILRLARSLKRGTRDLDFVRGSEAVREALDQAGLDDFFPFTPPYISNRGKPK
jgi:anti-anti-sigma factor